MSVSVFKNNLVCKIKNYLSIVPLCLLLLLSSQCKKSSESEEVIIPSNKPVIDNGTLLFKLDLDRGGAITYLSKSGTDRNIINLYDEGRCIQQSYYAGNSIDRTSSGQSVNWSPWRWNPIQVGDAFGNRAEIVDYKKSQDTLYVKCIPMLWDMNNEPAEAEMEQWTVLEDNILKVRNKLTCHRTDDIYGEGISCAQELPAVYPISALNNLYAYTGTNPFTNEDIEKLDVVSLSSGFWGIYYNLKEHWMAFVDDNNWGMAIYNPMCDEFLAGKSGSFGGETNDPSTCYIAPVKQASLVKNCVYEYEYYIVVGTLTEIRTKIYELNSQK